MESRLQFLRLVRAFAGAVLLLSATQALAQGSLPTQVGECTETTVAEIGPA